MPRELGSHQDAHDGAEDKLGDRGHIVPRLCAESDGANRDVEQLPNGYWRAVFFFKTNRIYSVRTYDIVWVAVDATADEEHNELRNVHHEKDT